ncbi:MAG TPA: hypothetical protein VK610_10780, partial [Rhodothermales bacterium]|nr:hypothetical protein [Rhodothermales bacterium]
MDVNGTRFHLLLGPGDWAGSAPPLGAGEVVWSAERGGLALRPLLYRFPRPDAHTPADRRGAGRDGFGHFYHVGADER